MDTPQNNPEAKLFDRRWFMRIAVMSTAAAAVWAMFRGGLLSLPRGRRTMSQDLPGEGSIFQPRNDPRNHTS